MLRTFTSRAYNTSERPNMGNKAIERQVLSSYQIAPSLGFNGDFRAWERAPFCFRAIFLNQILFSQASFWSVFMNSSNALGTTLRKKPVSAGTIDTIALQFSLKRLGDALQSMFARGIGG